MSLAELPEFLCNVEGSREVDGTRRRREDGAPTAGAATGRRRSDLIQSFPATATAPDCFTPTGTSQFS